MIEGKWLSANQAPTSQDYLRNGVITSGAPLVFLHIFFLLGHDITEADSDHIPRVVYCPAKIMRLMDDLGSAEVRTHTKSQIHLNIDQTFSDLCIT
jgi:(3S)-linalool synthase